MNEFSIQDNIIEDNINEELKRIDILNKNLKYYVNDRDKIINEINFLKNKLNSNSVHIEIYKRQIETARNGIQTISQITSNIKKRIDYYEEQINTSIMNNDIINLNENYDF